MRDLWRHHLDLDIGKLLATTLVSSHVDYCSSLLYDIVDTDLTKLLCVQNRLARLVTKSPPFTSSVPLLCSLHWLPVNIRIPFKISVLTYKAMHEKQPVYFHSMLVAWLPSCSLRSSKGISLLVLRVRTNTESVSIFCPRLSGTTCRCLSVQPFQLLPSRNIWRYISLTWPSPLDTGTPDSPLMPWTIASILLLNIDLPVVPMSLASLGILAL